MNVYLLWEDRVYDCFHESLIGVFASEEAAQKATPKERGLYKYRVHAEPIEGESMR